MRASRYQRIREIVREAGEPDFRARQALAGVFRQRARRWDEIRALPRGLRARLAQELGPATLSLRPVDETHAPQTRKVLFELADGERIESVRMQYRAGWSSYCISSQVGCGYACRFCATGTIGLKRQLGADEITDQILHFQLEGHPIDSVSFMGMGEALANRATFEALGLFTDPELFALGARRLSVSTVGLPRQMARLCDEFPQVNLTLSLHSPFDEQRSQLMPVNEIHPIEAVLAELDRHVSIVRRKVYLAYVLLGGVNDSPEHARALAERVAARPEPGLFHVNLIRFNSVPELGFAGTDPERAAAFVAELERRQVRHTIRRSFGTDVDAACGQLSAGYARSLERMGLGGRPEEAAGGASARRAPS